ncbi:hypothetical protein Hanom_Chr04g00332531 [Helianthus anomalus]
MWWGWAGSSLEVTGSILGCGIIGGGRPNDGLFLPRHGAVLRATRFLSSCYLSESLVWGSMVSGIRSVRTAAGAR